MDGPKGVTAQFQTQIPETLDIPEDEEEALFETYAIKPVQASEARTMEYVQESKTDIPSEDVSETSICTDSDSELE